MQIPAPLATASMAASALSQATSKERATAQSPDTDTGTQSTGLDSLSKTEQTSPDRDAQGGGEGLDRRALGQRRMPSTQPSQSQLDPELRAVLFEPPAQFDQMC